MSTKKSTAASKKKDEGNEAFRRSDFKTALARYNESLSIHPLAATFNNRAMTFISLEMYDEAIKDCHEVIQIEPDNAKAYYRRSLCYKSVGDLRNALEDIKISLNLVPDSKQVKTLHDDIEGMLFINKNCQLIQTLQVSAPTSPKICQCKFDVLQTTCVTNTTQRFHYISDDKETPVMGTYGKKECATGNSDDEWRETEDGSCATCNSYYCAIWNQGSSKKKCIPPSYPIMKLFSGCKLDLFAEGQTYHDYGFCNMEFFYQKDYYESNINADQLSNRFRDPSFRDPSQILLGLYQMIKSQICFKAEGNSSRVMSSWSFPLSMKALHQACEKNSLDAFIQQYIDDLISEGFKEHIHGTYPHMWRERKYIIGPTRLGVNDTAQKVEDTRKELFNYFYAD